MKVKLGKTITGCYSPFTRLRWSLKCWPERAEAHDREIGADNNQLSNSSSWCSKVGLRVLRGHRGVFSRFFFQFLVLLEALFGCQKATQPPTDLRAVPIGVRTKVATIILTHNFSTRVILTQFSKWFLILITFLYFWIVLREKCFEYLEQYLKENGAKKW